MCPGDANEDDQDNDNRDDDDGDDTGVDDDPTPKEGSVMLRVVPKCPQQRTHTFFTYGHFDNPAPRHC